MGRECINSINKNSFEYYLRSTPDPKGKSVNKKNKKPKVVKFSVRTSSSARKAPSRSPVYVPPIGVAAVAACDNPTKCNDMAVGDYSIGFSSFFIDGSIKGSKTVNVPQNGLVADLKEEMSGGSIEIGIKPFEQVKTPGLFPTSPSPALKKVMDYISSLNKVNIYVAIPVGRAKKGANGVVFEHGKKNVVKKRLRNTDFPTKEVKKTKISIPGYPTGTRVTVVRLSGVYRYLLTNASGQLICRGSGGDNSMCSGGSTSIIDYFALSEDEQKNKTEHPIDLRDQLLSKAQDKVKSAFDDYIQKTLLESEDAWYPSSSDGVVAKGAKALKDQKINPTPVLAAGSTMEGLVKTFGADGFKKMLVPLKFSARAVNNLPAKKGGFYETDLSPSATLPRTGSNGRELYSSKVKLSLTYTVQAADARPHMPYIVYKLGDFKGYSKIVCAGAQLDGSVAPAPDTILTGETAPTGDAALTGDTVPAGDIIPAGDTIPAGDITSDTGKSDK